MKGKGQRVGQQVCTCVTFGLLQGGVTFTWSSQNRPHFRLKGLLCLIPQQPLQEVSQELRPEMESLSTAFSSHIVPRGKDLQGHEDLKHFILIL